jgi:hypothetical protein
MPETRWSEGYGFLYCACLAAIYGIGEPIIYKVFGIMAVLMILNEAIRNVLLRSLRREMDPDRIGR